MNISLTLCDKELKGNVPNRECKNVESRFDNLNEPQELFYDWIKEKDFTKSVFVCFENMRKLRVRDLRDEQSTLLVSHNWDDITDFCEKHLDGESSYDVDFAVFEFEDYQDAFMFCKDLRESF